MDEDRKCPFSFHPVMGFRKIGGLKDYPRVQNAPALACCLDFSQMDQERLTRYDRFFGETLLESELTSVPMTETEKRAFGDAVAVSEECHLLTA